MEKDSFVFYKEWKDALSGYPDEVRLEFYEAIMVYGFSGKTSGLKPMAKLAFNLAKAKLDKENERIEETRKKRSEAGKKHKGNQFKNGTNGTSVPTMEQNGTNGTSVPIEKERKEKEEKVFPRPLSQKEKKDKKEKEGVTRDARDAACAAARFEARKEEFYNSLVPYVSKYGREMVRNFFDYWSEPNKSHSKMRFELEKTWDVSRRLSTWASRDNSFNGNGTNRTNHQTAEDRARGAADIIARLAATNKPVGE